MAVELRAHLYGLHPTSAQKSAVYGRLGALGAVLYGGIRYECVGWRARCWFSCYGAERAWTPKLW